MANRKISPDKLAQAEQMLAAGQSRKTVSQATGIGTSTLSRHFPNLKDLRGGEHPAPSVEPERLEDEPARPQPPRKPKPDPPPRIPKPPRGRRTVAGPTDEQLESMVRKIAKAPAVPAMMWLHCDYCATHFLTSAGPLAAELVAVSHDDQDLRDILVWMYTGWKRYAWAGMFASWFGIPVLHHAAPGWIYNIAGPLMGMPPRTSHHHEHHTRPMPAASPAAPYEPESAPEGQVPFPSPFMGMDIGEILAMAETLGVQLPPDVIKMAEELAANGDQPIQSAAAPVEPELTREQQDADLAAAAAEAAAAQAAALAADPDAE